MRERVTLDGGRSTTRCAGAPGAARGRAARTGARLALVLLLATLVAGCAPGGRSSAAAPAVTLLLPPGERPFWEPIAASFERAHPGVRVELVEGPQSTDLREGLYTASLLARDPTFSLVYMDVTWTSKFAAAGWLRPLDPWFDPVEQARYVPAALEAGRLDGRLYRIPVRTDVGVLYYRRDLLEEAGIPVPSDFASLRAAAAALQSPPDRWGFAWQGKQYEGLVCAFLEVLRGHGGSWVDPATREVGLDRPEAIAAVEFLRGCLAGEAVSPPGTTTYQEDESRRLFQDGRAVFLRNWPYVWRLAQAEESPVRGRVGVTAMVAAAGGRRSGTLGGWGLGVSAFARHPELAAAFIRHATSLESQRALCSPTGYAPARIEAYADDSLRAANPFLDELRRLHEGATARPALPRYALASDILQRHLSAALTGAVPPDEAMRRAAHETRTMMGTSTAAPRDRAGSEG